MYYLRIVNNRYEISGIIKCILIIIYVYCFTDSKPFDLGVIIFLIIIIILVTIIEMLNTQMMKVSFAFGSQLIDKRLWFHMNLYNK